MVPTWIRIILSVRTSQIQRLRQIWRFFTPMFGNSDTNSNYPTIWVVNLYWFNGITFQPTSVPVQDTDWPVGEHWYSVSDQKPPCTNSQSGEQFRNCAEVRIVKDCQQSPPTAGPTPTYGLSPNATRTPSRRPSRKPSRKPSKKPTSVMPTSRPKQLLTRKPATMAPAPLMCPASSNQCGPYITCDDIGFPNYCCSADGVSSCL